MTSSSDISSCQFDVALSVLRNLARKHRPKDVDALRALARDVINEMSGGKACSEEMIDKLVVALMNLILPERDDDVRTVLEKPHSQKGRHFGTNAVDKH